MKNITNKFVPNVWSSSLQDFLIFMTSSFAVSFEDLFVIFYSSNPNAFIAIKNANLKLNKI